ncbi:MAG: hypothetical protein JW913_07780 [Chitinispirillaceae bacterium]|nr:hypothetical protein [Chitinispirillaceae bacterium]
MSRKQCLTLACLSCIMISSPVSSGEWTLVNPSLTPQFLRSAYFFSPAVGWVGGRNGAIYHTIDSGNTWRMQQPPRNAWINSFSFHDENNGWAVGKYGFFTTTDGGSTWTDRPLAGFSNMSGEKIYFVNRNNGWLVLADNINHRGFLYHTEDGGVTWNDLSGTVGEPHLNDMVFLDDTTGFICRGAYIARTENGGKTWITADTAPEELGTYTWLQMFDKQTGYCLGRFGLVKTVDGGTTWSEVTRIGGNAGKSLMHFSSIDTGFILMLSIPAYICRTYNGGATWIDDSLPFEMCYISGLNFPEPRKGIAVSQDGSIYRILGGAGDTIYKITQGNGDELQCVDFSDEMRGFAGTGYVFPRDSALLYTDDGGTTWNKRAIPVPTVDKLLCLDSSMLIVHSLLPESIKTLKSTDWGFSWTTAGDFGQIACMKTIDNTPGAACILTVNQTVNQRELFMTRDTGKTWVNRGAIPNDTLGGFTSRPSSLHFLNSDTGWAFGENIHYTTDGGATWSAITDSLPFLCNLYSRSDITFISPNTGWAVGYSGSIHGDGHIFRTDDGGRTWREQASISYFPDWYLGPENATSHEFKKIVALDDGKRAWVLDADIGAAGVLHTVDGGEHWVQDSIPASPGMEFTDLHLNRHSNTLWLTSRSFGIWKQELTEQGVTGNPAPRLRPVWRGRGTYYNGILTIPLFHITGLMTVRLYNVSGRMVYSKKLAGTGGPLVLPLTLPSGYYIGCIHSGDNQCRENDLLFTTHVLE